MAQRELRNHADTGRDSALRAVQSLAFLVGTGVCLALSVVFAIQSVVPPAARSHVFSGERINPNEASVPSLVRLPQVGLARARAIVAHRDQVRSQAGRSPPFRTVDDLHQIRGIGPAIVEALRPWLEFDGLSHDSKEPAGR